MAKGTYCNRCGKKFDFFDEQSGISVSQNLGYGSEFDGSRLELDLCVDCIDELIEDCAIFPIVDRTKQTSGQHTSPDESAKVKISLSDLHKLLKGE